MTSQVAPSVLRDVVHVMGMPVSVALRGAGAERARDAWHDAIAVLRRADAVFSTYRADSQVSRLARGELTVRQCSPEVAEVLDLAERARLESWGAFDVHLPRPDGTLAFDPSGVVKGWAVQRAARCFADIDELDYCLSAGGDLVCGSGTVDSPGWRIGIEDPRDPTSLVAVVPIRDGGLATSALTHRGAHIVDPRTGDVPGELASVTVVAADLTAADVDATAAFVLGREAPDWLRQRGRSGVLVWTDGRVEVVAG